MLRNGQRPHEDDYALWPWCFMKQVTPVDATVLEIWIQGASPNATPTQKNKLDKMLGRFTEMAEWSASVMASSQRPVTSPGKLVDLLDNGFMPPPDAYPSAYAALALPLTTEQATLVHRYINGAARGASDAQKLELIEGLSKRWKKLDLPAHFSRAPGHPAAGASAQPPAFVAAPTTPSAACSGDPARSSDASQIARTVGAFKELLAASPAAATDENKWRHYPLPLSDEGAARLLYQAVVGASTTGADVRCMEDAEQMERCALHLDASIDAAERDKLIDSRDAVALRQALPRVRTAIGLIKEFPAALGMQLWFFGRTLALTAETRRPGAEQPWPSIEVLAGPLTHWVHYIPTKRFVEHGFLDVQMRMIERAANVGLISLDQKRLVIAQVAQVLETFHDWDGGDKGTVKAEPAGPRRVSVFPSNPQMVMQRLRDDFGFDDERLGRLRDDIRAHVDDTPDCLDSVAFYRKYSGCLAGTIGCSATRRAYQVLALAIHQALTGAFS